MVRPYHRFSVSAVACLLGLTTSSWGNEFPCVDGRCLPRSASPATAAPADAAPADEEPEPAQAAAASGPVMFAAPTPSGEVQGARSSYLLPSMEFSLPSMSLGLPQFRLLGMGRNRREPHMKLDQGTAPMANGAPAVYGPLLGASLQQRAAASAPAAPAKAAPAAAAPASAAPASNNCVDPCAIREQQEEVRQLTQQVQQLQGLLLQLAEQQAGGQQAAAESTETAEEEQPAPEVSYMPRKAKMVSTTRQVKNPTTRESVAAAKRLQQLQEILDEKQAEMEALQAEQEEVEAAEREDIEAEERRLAARKKQLEEERVSRLRNRMARESTSEEPVARKVSMIERMSFEDEEAVEEEAPKKVTSKPTRMKSVPATPIRRTAAQKFEAEER